MIKPYFFFHSRKCMFSEGLRGLDGSPPKTIHNAEHPERIQTRSTGIDSHLWLFHLLWQKSFFSSPLGRHTHARTHTSTHTCTHCNYWSAACGVLCNLCSTSQQQGKWQQTRGGEADAAGKDTIVSPETGPWHCRFPAKTTRWEPEAAGSFL